MAHHRLSFSFGKSSFPLKIVRCHWHFFPCHLSCSFVVLNVVVKFWLSMAMIFHPPKLSRVLNSSLASFEGSSAEVIYTLPQNFILSAMRWQVYKSIEKTSVSLTHLPSPQLTASNPCVLKHCKRVVEPRYHLISWGEAPEVGLRPFEGNKGNTLPPKNCTHDLHMVDVKEQFLTKKNVTCKVCSIVFVF